MKLEFHQLDRRYEHLRARNPDRQRRLMTSLAASGQQTPIVVIAVSTGPDRYRVIDGYKSVKALEQGWLLQEMEQRFGYSLEDLARRFDRSVSWVSRRLALVEQLPETVQQRVRSGEISAQVAMKYLAPVARANLNDCQRMADAFSKYRFSSRQAGELYTAWRDASASIRQRILDSPELFLKAHQQVSPQPESPADELLRDLTMVLAITNRASRRLARASPLMGNIEFESARRKIECAVRDLTHLAERIEKEHDHVEPKSADRDSGASLAGSLQTRDRPSSERIPLERAQSPAVEVIGIAGTG